MRKQLARSAGVIGIAITASRILGLIRDQILAYFFGAADAMDAYRIAFRLPNIFRDLFAEGVMSAAVVPTFTRVLRTDGRTRAWDAGRNLVTAALLLTGAIVAVGVVFTRPLALLYAGQFAEVPGKMELTIQMTRMMFPFLMMVAMAAVFMGMLNALHHFFVPALAPAMFNLATIALVPALVPLFAHLGWEPVFALAVTTLVGGFAQAVVQWPALRREGFQYRPVFDTTDPVLRDVARLTLPALTGLAAVQVNLFVNSWLATGLGTGAVSWLDYAFRLMYMPIGLFGISIATASLPGISAHAATNDLKGLRDTLSSGIGMMLMLNVPATFGLITLASPIVQLIFERGRFTPADTAATSAALACYAPGLVGYSLVKLISPVFYALGESRIPVAISASSIALNIVLNLTLVGILGHRGLALGTAIAALANGAALIWIVRARLGGLHGRQLSLTLVKIVLASSLMAAAVYTTELGLASLFIEPSLPVHLIRVFGAIAAGLLTLAVAAHTLRIEEFTEAVRVLRARLSGPSPD